MKILLINFPSRLWALPNTPPLGLMIIYSFLKHNLKESQIDFMDYNIERDRLKGETIKDIAKDYDYILISALITSYNLITAFLKTKKDIKGKVIIGNGIGAIGEHLCKQGLIDSWCFGVRGDNYLNRIIFEHKADFNYKYDRFLFSEKYYENIVGFGEKKSKWQGGSRQGRSDMFTFHNPCPYDCIFCSKTIRRDSLWSININLIIDDIKKTIQQRGITSFVVADDYNSNAIINNFSKRLIEEKINLDWGCSYRISEDNILIMDAMRKAGCKYVGIGIESGSNTILKYIKKNYQAGIIAKNMKKLKRFFPEVRYTLILGFPPETKKTIAETKRLVGRIGFPPENVFFATPYPETELWDIALPIIQKKYGIKDEPEIYSQYGEQHELKWNLTEELKDRTLIKAREKLLGR